MKLSIRIVPCAFFLISSISAFGQISGGVDSGGNDNPPKIQSKIEITRILSDPTVNSKVGILDEFTEIVKVGQVTEADLVIKTYRIKASNHCDFEVKLTFKTGFDASSTFTVTAGACQ